MDQEEIKFILSAYREGQNYEEDPKIAEALSEVKTDADLSQWFSEQQKLDTTMASAVQSVTPPAGLKSAIMAGGDMVNRSRRRRFFRNATLLAAAAILMIGFTLFRPKSPTIPTGGFASIEEVSMHEVAKLAHGRSGFDIRANGGSVGDMMNGLHLASSDINPKLAGIPAAGCKSIPFHDKSIAIICFSVEGKLCHLVIIDDPKTLEEYPSTGAKLAKTDEWLTSKWKNQDHGYLLITAVNNPPVSFESLGG